MSLLDSNLSHIVTYFPPPPPPKEFGITVRDMETPISVGNPLLRISFLMLRPTPFHLFRNVFTGFSIMTPIFFFLHLRYLHQFVSSKYIQFLLVWLLSWKTMFWKIKCNIYHCLVDHGRWSLLSSLWPS